MEYTEAVRERAYALWEQEDRPDGKAIEHWLRAEAEIAAANTLPKRSVTRRGKAPRSR